MELWRRSSVLLLTLTACLPAVLIHWWRTSVVMCLHWRLARMREWQREGHREHREGGGQLGALREVETHPKEQW